jgi:hypothetical protein
VVRERVLVRALQVHLEPALADQRNRGSALGTGRSSAGHVVLERVFARPA